MQKRAAKVILDAPKLSSVELFNKLWWLPFYEDVKISKFLLAFRRLLGETALYINEALTLKSEIRKRCTRYAKL